MKCASILAALCAAATGPVSAEPQSTPVHIEETGRSPEGPPTTADLAYDNRLRASMAATQSFAGPMDGGWTLSAGGRDLYVFQLTDRNGAVQGAWRDPRRPGALDASGLIDQIELTDTGLTVRIGDRIVALQADVEGRWKGDLSEDGRTVAVILRR